MPNSKPNLYQEDVIIKTQTADMLLSNVRLHKELQQIQQLVNIPVEYYQETYALLINHFAVYVQAIPSVPGGALGTLLVESVQRAHLAIQLQIAEAREQEPLFTFALFSAALFLDLRQLFANKKIVLSDDKGVFMGEWSPFESPLTEAGSFYKIRNFHRPIIYLSPYLNVLLARQIIPAAGLAWLSDETRLLNMWLGALCGDEESAGGLAHFLALTKQRMQQMEKKPKVSIAVEISQPKETALGEAFWTWLKNIIAEGELNKPDPGIYAVEEGILLEVPKVFDDFCIHANSLKPARIIEPTVVRQQFLELGIVAVNDKDPDQLFIYLPKDDILPSKKVVKGAVEIKTAGNFFGKALEKAGLGLKEGEQLEAGNRKQGLLIAEREWFFRFSKKAEINKQVKLFLAKEKAAKCFRALKRLLAKKTLLARRKLNFRFK